MGEVDYADDAVVAHGEAVRNLGQELDGLLAAPLLGPSKVAIAWDAGLRSVQQFTDAPFDTLVAIPGFGRAIASTLYAHLGKPVPRPPPLARTRSRPPRTSSSESTVTMPVAAPPLPGSAERSAPPAPARAERRAIIVAPPVVPAPVEPPAVLAVIPPAEVVVVPIPEQLPTPAIEPEGPPTEAIAPPSETVEPTPEVPASASPPSPATDAPEPGQVTGSVAPTAVPELSVSPTETAAREDGPPAGMVPGQIREELGLPVAAPDVPAAGAAIEGGDTAAESNAPAEETEPEAPASVPDASFAPEESMVASGPAATEPALAGAAMTAPEADSTVVGSDTEELPAPEETAAGPGPAIAESAPTAAATTVPETEPKTEGGDTEVPPAPEEAIVAPGPAEAEPAPAVAAMSIPEPETGGEAHDTDVTQAPEARIATPGPAVAEPAPAAAAMAAPEPEPEVGDGDTGVEPAPPALEMAGTGEVAPAPTPEPEAPEPAPSVPVVEQLPSEAPHAPTPEPVPPPPPTGLEVDLSESLLPALQPFLEETGAGHHGLAIVREMPERIRAHVGPRPVVVYWLTNLVRDRTIKPNDLNAVAERFTKALDSESVTAVFFEGVEYPGTHPRDRPDRRTPPEHGWPSQGPRGSRVAPPLAQPDTRVGRGTDPHRARTNALRGRRPGRTGPLWMRAWAGGVSAGEGLSRSMDGSDRHR